MTYELRFYTDKDIITKGNQIRFGAKHIVTGTINGYVAFYFYSYFLSISYGV